MSDLATLNTRYGTVAPWFDLRDFLANGWRALSTQAVGVCVMPNLLFWAVTVVADDATSSTVLEGVPEQFRGPQNMRLLFANETGSFNGQLQRSTGNLYANLAGFNNHGGRTGTWAITGVIPAGQAVT